jgi:predicted proteasome-type protease
MQLRVAESMTYCGGILVREGLVMFADTRSNAGIDNISTFRKLHIFKDPKKRTGIPNALLNVCFEGQSGRDVDSGQTTIF